MAAPGQLPVGCYEMVVEYNGDVEMIEIHVVNGESTRCVRCGEDAEDDRFDGYEESR